MIFVLLLLSSFICFINCDDILNTSHGPVKGYTSGGIQYFRGIPFAAPPIGENRFKPPQPLKSWSTPKPAYYEGEICPQVHSVGPVVLGSEDCLYLDVYRPSDPSLTNLPIMIWMFGGGWVFGDKYEFGFYDATNMVLAEPHIHVAMNYRVGALGFMSLPELFAESNTTGNYGLQDQLAAMQWVQNNAKALRGDPNQVTIFGESAGAFSVCWHMVSQASKGLFNRAIMESGTCDSGAFFRTRQYADAFSSHYSESIGCPNDGKRVECLRALQLAAVFNGDLYGPAPLAPVMPWAATIDHAANGLQGMPLQLMREGKYNKVPLLMGTNNNEGDIFVAAVPLVANVDLPLTKAGLHKAGLHFWNSSVVDKMIQVYEHYDTYEHALSQALTDWFFACPARRTGAALSEQKTPIYIYHWSFLPTNWIDDDILGDFHTSEIQFVYGNAWPPLVHWFDARDKRMVQIMQNYWLSFADGGTPNFKNKELFWPQYNPINQTNMRLDIDLELEQYYRADVCSLLWDHVPPIH